MCVWGLLVNQSHGTDVMLTFPCGGTVRELRMCCHYRELYKVFFAVFVSLCLFRQENVKNTYNSSINLKVIYGVSSEQRSGGSVHLT